MLPIFPNECLRKTNNPTLVVAKITEVEGFQPQQSTACPLGSRALRSMTWLCKARHGFAKLLSPKGKFKKIIMPGRKDLLKPYKNLCQMVKSLPI